MMTIKKLVAFAALLILTTFSAEARHYGLICGATQRAYFGVGSNRALDWAHDFPRVGAQVGAVVVQTRSGRDSAGGPGGHVSRIVSMTSNPCRAIVADPRGRYERDICKRLVAYVMPGAKGIAAGDAEASPTHRGGRRLRIAHHGRRLRGHGGVQVAQAWSPGNW